MPPRPLAVDSAVNFLIVACACAIFSVASKLFALNFASCSANLPDSVANLQIQGTVLWKNPIFPVRMITGSMPDLTGISTYVVADRAADKDTHIVQPNITVDRTITTANNFAEVEFPSLNSDTSYFDRRGFYGDPHYEYGQSYVRPKDRRVNNILRVDN